MDLCVNPRLFWTSALRWGAGIWGEDEEGEGSSACLGLIHTPSLSFVFIILCNLLVSETSGTAQSLKAALGPGGNHIKSSAAAASEPSGGVNQ